MAEDRTTRRDRLAQRRKAQGLTQEALAGLLGVKRSTVARWERGETEPHPWMRSKLASALRVSADRIAELLADDAPTGNSPGAGHSGAPTAVPRQLPAAVPGFTGRAAEIETLTRLLDGADGSAPGTVVISAIGGTAGVGKTALAVHWAHQVAHRFGDGQVHMNLRGFDPSGVPATPPEAIRGMLDALGVPAERVPPDPDTQAALYRGMLAGKRMLIVLDNARDEQQVRPLLPASPGSLVLVTSRSQLAGLAAADGARLLSLDVLPHREAVQLLTARIGRLRAAAEPVAVAEIATLCAHLPLALAVAAARAAGRPAFALASLAAELRDADRLDALDSGDPSASVRAVFSWSYRQLSTGAARMFRLLGLHPGPDISIPAAASLAGASEPEARRVLRELARDGLVIEHVPGRYAFHDLLRAYAAALARDSDSESERHDAVGRVLDHYLHTASRGAFLIRRVREPIALAAPSPAVVPEQLADSGQALVWFDTEYRVLLAAVTLADGGGFDRHAWQLPWTMFPYRTARGYYLDQTTVQRTALDAATRLGDTIGQAVSSRLLAIAWTECGDYDQALRYFTTGLELYRRLGDHLGEAVAHQNLGKLADRQGHYADALGHDKQALLLYRAVGNKAATAETLNCIGWDYAHLGDYQQARAFCQQALALNAEAGNHGANGNVWDSLGYAEHHLGNYAEAASCYQRALSVFRKSGSRFDEADALTHLGDTHRAAGRPRQAREAWQQALAIFDDIDHPDAGGVRAKLAGTAPSRGDTGHPSS